MSELFALMSTSGPVPKLSAVVLESFAAVLRSCAAVPRLSVVMLRLCLTVPRLSTAVFGLSAPTSVSVLVPGLSALVFPFAFAPVLRLSSLFMYFCALIPGLSPLSFPVLFLPKTLMFDPTARRRKIDHTICVWRKRSKKASSKKLWSGILKTTALKEIFSPWTHLFLIFFLSSSIGKKRKFNNTFINSRLFINNYAKKEIDLSFAGCGCPLAIK